MNDGLWGVSVRNYSDTISNVSKTIVYREGITKKLFLPKNSDIFSNFYSHLYLEVFPPNHKIIPEMVCGFGIWYIMVWYFYDRISCVISIYSRVF